LGQGRFGFDFDPSFILARPSLDPETIQAHSEPWARLTSRAVRRGGPQLPHAVSRHHRQSYEQHRSEAIMGSENACFETNQGVADRFACPSTRSKTCLGRCAPDIMRGVARRGQSFFSPRGRDEREHSRWGLAGYSS
jgi:hypothetical protein